MSVLVSANDDRSKVMVLDDALDKPLVRIDGSWGVGVFSPDELKDFFVRVTDSKEEATLAQEAGAALKSNPDLPRSETHAA